MRAYYIYIMQIVLSYNTLRCVPRVIPYSSVYTLTRILISFVLISIIIYSYLINTYINRIIVDIYKYINGICTVNNYKKKTPRLYDVIISLSLRMEMITYIIIIIITCTRNN